MFLSVFYTLPLSGRGAPWQQVRVPVTGRGPPLSGAPWWAQAPRCDLAAVRVLPCPSRRLWPRARPLTNLSLSLTSCRRPRTPRAPQRCVRPSRPRPRPAATVSSVVLSVCVVMETCVCPDRSGGVRGTVCGLAGNWGGSRGRRRSRGAGATPEAPAGSGEARRPPPSTAASTAPWDPGTQPCPSMKQALGPRQGGCAPRVGPEGAAHRAGSQVVSALAPTTLLREGWTLGAPRATEELGGGGMWARFPVCCLKPQVRAGVGGNVPPHRPLPHQQRLVFSSGSCSLAVDENAGAGGPGRATLRVRVCRRVSWMFSCMRHVGVHV